MWKAKIFKTLTALLIAVVPAALGYCQARTELKQKWLDAQEETQRVTQVSYDELAKSVQELQDTVQKQHDDILRIQTYVSVLEDFLSVTENRLHPGHPAFYVARPDPPAKPVLTAPRNYGTVIKK